MAQETILKAESKQEGFPEIPFNSKLPDGAPYGAALGDNQYVPGTPEYRLRSNDQFRAVNRQTFGFFESIVDPNRPAMMEPGVTEVGKGRFGQAKEFMDNILGLLPEGNRTPADAAWYAVNVMSPQSKHDAKYVLGKIRPAIEAKIKQAQEAGGSFYPTDLNEKDIIDLAKQSGVDPWVVSKMIAEEGEIDSRKATKTYTMGHLKPMVDMLDIETQWGKMVFENPEEHLFTKTGQARRDAFLAMARWKDKSGPSFLGGMVEGIGHLIGETGYAAGGFVEGSIGTIVSAGSLGNVLMENGRTVLSDAWINRPREEQDEANRVLQKAHELATRYGPQLSATIDEPGKFAAKMENLFGQYADKTEVDTFRRLLELRDQGAYRPQMSWERLANFGEGVLSALPTMAKMFNSSIDPNSVFFRTEANMAMLKDIPVAGRFLGAPRATAMGVYQAWVQSSKAYKDMLPYNIDQSIDVWSENYRDLRGDGESVTGFFYRKSAEALEATGANARTLRAGERATKSMMQEERLIQAGQLADPVMLFVGGLKLLGIGAEAAANAKRLQSVTQGLREVTSEAATLRASANATSATFDAAVGNLRTRLEAAIPGAQFTDDDIIGIAIGDRRSVIGQTPSAQIIRKEIGTTISKNKSLATKVQDLQKQLDALPDDAAGIDKLRVRPVGGAVASGIGSATKGTGTVADTLANWLDDEYQTMRGGQWWRRIGSVGVKYGIGGAAQQGLTTAGLAGAFLFQGDILGAALAGGGYISVAQVLRPDRLRAFGATAQQAGRIQKVIAQNLSEGRRYGESSFLRGAIDLEKQASDLLKQINVVPGGKLTTAEEAIKTKANMLVDDATLLRRMHKNGVEAGLRNTARVVWEDGVVAGSTGALIASLNDEDATGAGAGMGIGVSGVLTAANRIYKFSPKGAEPVYTRSVVGDVATIMTEVKDPVQRANMLEFLGKAGEDGKAFIQRAGILRDLHISTRGKVKFVKGGEFEAATILTASPEAQANIIMAEAAALHPGDPAAARDYAAARMEKLNEARAASHRATALAGDSAANKAKADELNRSVKALDTQIAEAEAVVEKERIEFKDIKTVDANRIKLDKLKQQRSEAQASLDLVIKQQTVIDGDLNKAKGESKVEAPMRPYEKRAMPDGSTVRSISNGFYIQDGPQGRSVYVNIDGVDNIGAISEGWHALLADSSVEALMPEMVNMMWGDIGKSYYGANLAVDPKVTVELLRAYAADLPAAQRAKYQAEIDAGLIQYKNSGGKDVAGLIEPTREAMTWILSAMDLDKRPGYRPGLATPRGMEASSVSFDAFKRTIFGDRTVGDNVVSAFKSLFDPTYGMLTRAHTDNYVRQLEQAGMRFVESGDGTLRGYFMNGNNEIIRSPVLDAFYDKVVVATGGKGSLRARPINLYDPMVPKEARIDFVKRNGMDWVLNDKGTEILTPEEIGAKGTQYAKAIEDVLNGVPEDARGMEVYVDEGGRPIRTGIPTAAEIAAVASDTTVPESYKRNLLTVMRTLASGESKAVLSAEYSNVFSVNIDQVTEHRLRVGKDISGKTETRDIIPLGFTMGEAPIYDSKGNKVKTKDATGKTVDATQRVIRLHAFDTRAFANSTNSAFTQGLFIVDDAGTRSYLKDPKGNQYTADYINSLFGSQSEFMNKATLWMNHYYKAGPIDPRAPIPKNPNGSPREVNPVSAEVLDPVNPERGAAMRDALRMIFSLESGKKRLGWVTENRQTNTANGVLIRGTNFPITDFRLDQFGALKETGQSMFIDQRGVTSGQFVMSIKGWESKKTPLINGVPTFTVKPIVEAGENKFLPGTEILVSETRSHPNVEGVKLFIGTQTRPGGKPMKTLAYTVGDGRIIELNTTSEREAIEVIRQKVASREDAAYVDEILNEWRSNRDKPVEGTLPAKVEDTGPSLVYRPVKSTKDFIGILEGVYSTIEGKGVPPSVREFINEFNLEAAVANGKSAEDILGQLLEAADKRKNWAGSGDKYRAVANRLKEAQDLIRSQSYNQQVAYEVPTQGKNMNLQTIKRVFNLVEPFNATELNQANYRAADFFEITKELPDKFSNNKEYLEAIIANLDEKLFNAADLEGEAFKKKHGELSNLKNIAEQALLKLEKNSPELWEQKPAAPATEATTTTNTPEATAAPVVENPNAPRPPVIRDAPYMTVEEIAATRQFRVEADGRIIRVTEKQLSERDRFDQRYKAILKQIEVENKKAATAATKAEREQRQFIAEQNRARALEVQSEEQFAAQYRRRAQEEARRDARAAAEAQREADRAQARADALKLQFERGYEAARATADDKRAKTNQLIELALSSNQPLIAPGLLLVDANRMPIETVRTAVATDTVSTPSVTTRSNVIYLKNLTGYESQTQAFQQAFCHYLHGEGVGKGKAIAGEAFRGPMAAQQGINLMTSQIWVAENSGGRLLREYKKADKAAGKDIVTYKVYGSNGMVIKQTNDASDAIEAIQNLERRFIASFRPPLGPLTANPERAGAAANALTAAYMMPPASVRPRGGINLKEGDMTKIPGVERYLPVEPK